MSEKNVTYNAGNAMPLNLEAFKNRPCALLYDERYQPPTPEEVAQLINLAGWSQNDAAKLVGVSWDTKRGSSTIRKWKSAKGQKEHREIPFSAWCLFLMCAGVISPDDALKAIGKPPLNLK